MLPSPTLCILHVNMPAFLPACCRGLACPAGRRAGQGGCGPVAQHHPPQRQAQQHPGAAGMAWTWGACMGHRHVQKSGLRFTSCLTSCLGIGLSPAALSPPPLLPHSLQRRPIAPATLPPPPPTITIHHQPSIINHQPPQQPTQPQPPTARPLRTSWSRRSLRGWAPATCPTGSPAFSGTSRACSKRCDAPAARVVCTSELHARVLHHRLARARGRAGGRRGGRASRRRVQACASCEALVHAPMGGAGHAGHLDVSDGAQHAACCCTWGAHLRRWALTAPCPCLPAAGILPHAHIHIHTPDRCCHLCPPLFCSCWRRVPQLSGSRSRG